jgi:peroxiredoxin
MSDVHIRYYRVYSVAVTLIAVLALIQTAFLVRANNASARLSNTMRQIALDRPMSEGDKIVQLTGVDIRGRWQSIRTLNDVGRRSLLVAVAANCEFCESSVPVFKRIAPQAVAAGMQMIWVSRDSPAETALNEHLTALPGTLVTDPTHFTWIHVKLSYVPQTAILSPDGAVARVWVGALDTKQEKEIVRQIGKG